MAADAVSFRLDEHDRRLDGLHRSIGRVSVDVGGHKEKLATVRGEIDEIREDIRDIKSEMKEDRVERRKEGSDTRRALYILASTMVTFTLSMVGLTATLLNG